MAESQKVEEQASGITTEEGEFSSLLQKQFKPQSPQARSEVENAVRTLAAQVRTETEKAKNKSVSKRNRS